MKKRYSEEQVIGILREGEKSGKIREVCRRHAVTEQTCYRWRKKYAGMEVSDIRRLRELAKENAQLKRLLAERDLEIDVMKEVLSKKW